MSGSGERSTWRRRAARLRPLLLLAVPVAAAAAGYAVAGSDLWHPDALLARRDLLMETAAAAPLASLAIFTLVYFAIISSALPVGPPMSLIAGFLFGRWVGSGAILLGATAGALVVFSLARVSAGSRLGDGLRARAGSVLAGLSQDFREHAFGYLMVMRLVPVFPFFLVNVVAGLAGVSVRAFLWATLIGRIPAVFIYVSLGEQVGRVSSFAELLSPGIFMTLSALGVLALSPLLLTRGRRRRLARLPIPGLQAGAPSATQADKDGHDAAPG